MFGCAPELHSSESALNPAGPQAERLSSLIWLFTWVCVVVYVLVMAALVGAFVHRRHGAAAADDNGPIEPEPHYERRVWSVVAVAIGVTVVTLFGLLFADFATGRSIERFGRHASPDETLRIEIVGHQWWWEVRYVDWPQRFGERGPSNIVSGANEIHVPVDPQHPVPVECQLDSHDVIHSFWVPNLQGKKDLVPGHPTSIWLRADRVGTYWGECAEYCGYQHAQMRFVVVAEPVEQFNAWLDLQRHSAPEPSNLVQVLGRDVFLRSSCAMCHTIQGTDAAGRVGPDLTHVAGRKVLAAGAVPNVPGHLAGWIVDPQRVKPGTRMPQTALGPLHLRALLEYLETLK